MGRNYSGRALLPWKKNELSPEYIIVKYIILNNILIYIEKFVLIIDLKQSFLSFERLYYIELN